MNTRTKIGLVILFSLGLLIGGSKLFKEKVYRFENLKSPDAIFNRLDIEQKNNSEELEKIVQKRLKDYKESTEDDNATFAVVIESLPSTDSGRMNEEFYRYNEEETMYSASLYKLVVIAGIFKEIEEGDLSKDTYISSSKARLSQIYGGVDFGYENAPETIGYTVDEALDRVARVSDNFAAILLTDKIWQLYGFSGYQTSDNNIQNPLTKIAKELGMENTVFGNDGYPTTTASDIAWFFRQLYEGNIVSKDASDEILQLLSKAQSNNRIPADLPEGTRVAHKTGELSRIRHDAGIVYLPNGDAYIIVMMSSDVNENDAIETMANLSKDVYDYFDHAKTVE